MLATKNKPEVCVQREVAVMKRELCQGYMVGQRCAHLRTRLLVEEGRTVEPEVDGEVTGRGRRDRVVPPDNEP